MARKAVPQKNLIAFYKDNAHGYCAACHEFWPIDKFQIDHIHPVALGGTNDPDNLQFLCRDCHKIKTSGTKATTYGSDIHEIRKTKRLSKAQAALEAGEKKTSKHKWPKGKIPSRPFPKRNKEAV